MEARSPESNYRCNAKGQIISRESSSVYFMTFLSGRTQVRSGILNAAASFIKYLRRESMEASNIWPGENVVVD